jgi:hypothetical protein
MPSSLACIVWWLFSANFCYGDDRAGYNDRDRDAESTPYREMYVRPFQVTRRPRITALMKMYSSTSAPTGYASA